jgi:hypothetical protein
MFNKGITYFVLVAVFMIWIWLFFWKGSLTNYQQVEVVKTDTVYVNRPYKEVVIKEVEIEKPVKVYVYKTDTVYRKKLEKDTIISAIQIEPKKAIIHTITPTGIPLVKKYPIEAFKAITINHQGDLKTEKKKRHKKFWRNLERSIFFICGILTCKKMM